jgi:hypothetical protein
MPSPANGTGSVLAQGVATTAVTYVYGPITDTNKQVQVKGLVFSNESGTATTVSYGVVKAGKTPGAAGTSQAKSTPIGAAGSTTATIDAEELEDFVLGTGDGIWVQAGANTAVAYVLNGIAY